MEMGDGENDIMQIYSALDEFFQYYKIFDSDAKNVGAWPKRDKARMTEEAVTAYRFLFRMEMERKRVLAYMMKIRPQSGAPVWSEEDDHDDDMEEEEDRAIWLELDQDQRRLLFQAILFVQASPPSHDDTAGSFIRQMRSVQIAADEYWREFSAFTNRTKPYLVPSPESIPKDPAYEFGRSNWSSVYEL